MTVLALLGLSAVLLLALQRPRRPTEDDPLGSRAPQRRRTSLVLTLLPVALLLAAVWYVLWNRWSGQEQHPIERAFTALAGLLDLIAHYRKPATSVPFFDLTIAAAVLLFALGLFALMVAGGAGRASGEVVGGAEAVTRRPSRPRSRRASTIPVPSADPRRAIVRAYGALRARAGRRPRAPRARGRRRRSSCAPRWPGFRCRPRPSGASPRSSSSRASAIARWAPRRATPPATAWTRSTTALDAEDAPVRADRLPRADRRSQRGAGRRGAPRHRAGVRLRRAAVAGPRGAPGRRVRARRRAPAAPARVLRPARAPRAPRRSTRRARWREPEPGVPHRFRGPGQRRAHRAAQPALLRARSCGRG